MSDYVIPAPPLPSLPVIGETRRYPIRRIFCVARNYAEHVKEMGSDPKATPPTFFCKPADAVVEPGASIEYPSATQTLHHEVELVVALQKGGVNISAQRARDCIFGCATGLDLTRRDIQAAAKERRGPWDMAKGFDKSAPCGSLVRLTPETNLAGGRIWLTVNGEPRQEGDLSQMIWPVEDIIEQLSYMVRLRPGDLIYTGTPSGVGQLNCGDQVDAGVEGFGRIQLSIT